MAVSYLVILGIIITFSTGFAFAESDPIITVEMNGPSTFYLDTSDIIIRANVEVQNYTPSDGQYFMKIIYASTGTVVKEVEIYLRSSGNDLWSAQIAYPVLESQIATGEYEILISTEFGSQTGSTKFSILESQDEPEPTPEPETIPEPEPESVPELSSNPEDENFTGVAEIIEEIDDGIGEQVSIQMDEESVQNLSDILPYLGIIIAGVIGGIIIIKKRNSGKDDELSEDYEYDEKNSVIEDAPLTKKFQDMQTDSQSNDVNDFDPEKIIENNLRIISELQKHKIGDNDKLEAIKKSLIEDESFTQEASEYLEEKYEEYKKITKKDSEE